MSKYTTEVRFICENYAGLNESEGYNKVADIIANSRAKVFDFDYPIFDENYRSVIESKILKHFYLREICAETVGVWKHFLDMRMNEIMPYYNKLYESELIEFNPMYDVDLTKDYNRDGKGTGTVGDVFSETEVTDRNNDITTTDTGTIDTETEGENHADNTATTSGSEADVQKNTRWDIYSDTPQGGLTNVNNEEYLTNARKIIDDGTGSTKTTSQSVNEDNDTAYSETGTQTRNLTGTRNEEEDVTKTRNNTNTRTRNLRDIEDYIEHVTGKSAGVSFSKLLQEFRETFLNIDMLIIKDLNDLFFGLW